VDDIEQILSAGSSARELRDVPSHTEVSASEAAVNFRYPPDYIRFLELGGLGELRISSSILSPRQITLAWQQYSLGQYVPFADNHCGDYYCWRRDDSVGFQVYFFDHETSEATIASQSFSEWLRNSRF
jgi:hypothetical protein